MESINNDIVNSACQIEKHKDGDILTRDDFDGGPVSLDLIEPRLWLGNLTAATDKNELEKYKITHILTVDSCPLPRRITDLAFLTTKLIQITDIPKEDILSHFEDSYQFISEGQDKGTVLVHCYFGVSRSSTIILAYMMKKHILKYEEALELVKSKRKFACPNTGFVFQLKLYESMDCVLDKNNPKYRDFRLKVAADKVKRVKILPHGYMDLIKFDPGIMQLKPEPSVYRCKKCRRIVASQSNIVTHYDRELKIQLKTKQKLKKQSSLSNSSENEDSDNDILDKADEEKTAICTKTFFIEPIAWMKNISQTAQGKLYCPKCNNKLGSFSWIMGCRCPCGTNVAPAFYLVPSKVERSNVVQNVQVTV